MLQLSAANHLTPMVMRVESEKAHYLWRNCALIGHQDFLPKLLSQMRSPGQLYVFQANANITQDACVRPT